MSISYLDTNVFIRFLTQDQLEHAQRAYNLFKEVEEGRQRVTTVEMVIAEIVFILSSRKLYNLPRVEIKLKLLTILSLKGFVLTHKRTYQRALDIYASTSLDFVDAYLVAVTERTDLRLVTFDSALSKAAGTKHEVRQKPPSQARRK